MDRSGIVKQVLEKLNPVHIPTFNTWIEIADIICEPKGENAAQIQMINIIHLIKQFEAMVRGAFVANPVFKPTLVDGIGLAYDATEKRLLWQDAILTKERFQCILKEPKYTDFPKLAGFDSYALEEATDKYESAKRKVWFEWKGAKGFQNNYIDCLEEGTLIWDFIFMSGQSWNFTENFVNELLNIKIANEAAQ